MNFGRIWGGFGKEFWKNLSKLTMIRATKGKSMDGWMDGWSRPNHMPSHLDALPTTSPVAFRRLLGGLHSVAKQASFYVAFGADVGGFRRPKWTSKLNFEQLFFRVFVESIFALNFN